MKRYDYWPIVVDRQFSGLWHFDNYSHRGPIYIINGKHTATIVRLFSEESVTIDSLDSALQKYPFNEINPAVRAEIVKNI